MNINERIEQIVKEFADLKSWEDRYARLIEYGKGLPTMDESQKTEDNRIRGCQSQVWMTASLREGKVKLSADSDAILVRGIVALLLKVYSDETPEVIVKTSPDFLNRMGLVQNLTPSRANGLMSMIKQIKMYALAFSTKV